MKKYELILFDFDGTLADSSEGILNSLQYALEKFDLDKKIKDRQRFIGPPLHYSFKNFCGLNEKESDRAIRLYREYYTKEGVFQLSLYPGIEQLLEQTRNNYHNLIIATSKAQAYTDRIISQLHLQDYFIDIVGANLDGSFSEKGDIITTILSKHKNFSRDKTLMIGDREYDINGAHENNIDSVGVTYGFGSKKEIRDANPTYTADTVSGLNTMLNKTLPGN